jgi:CheY-like chemotaxis protein
MVQRINSAGRSLLGIINDILDFSKIEAGQLSVEQRPFKLTELIAHIDSMMRAVARGKGLTLNLQEVSPVPGRLSGDALRIEQVLMNLVGNALKFTEQGGVTIRVAPVTVTETSARLRFEIQDTGIGLSPEAVAKLFQPFTQADSGITRRFGGTGLGLSISKRLVELMGGEIGVESTPGVGSTFWFELPFERLADEEKTAASAAEVKGPRLQGLRLLVVDDSQLNRYLAERVLQREGAEVTLVNDGQQALDALRANPQGFDLVLMDIMMPVMDGLAATRAIREEPQLKTLPVIALTAGVLAEEKQSALDAGVNDFLPKPMDMDLMVSMIRSYCPASA